jgi:hypothetical protein
MFAEHDRAGVFVSQKSENLRGLAIKAFTELHAWWDGFCPPITVNMPIGPNIAHVG